MLNTFPHLHNGWYDHPECSTSRALDSVTSLLHALHRTYFDWLVWGFILDTIASRRFFHARRPQIYDFLDVRNSMCPLEQVAFQHWSLKDVHFNSWFLGISEIYWLFHLFWDSCCKCCLFGRQNWQLKSRVFLSEFHSSFGTMGPHLYINTHKETHLIFLCQTRPALPLPEKWIFLSICRPEFIQMLFFLILDAWG